MDPSTILASLAKLSSGIIYALLACCLWMMVITGTGVGWDLKPVSFSNAFQYAIPALLGTWFLWLNYRREKSEVAATSNATTGRREVRGRALALIVNTLLAAGIIVAILLSAAAYYRADLDTLRNLLLIVTADDPTTSTEVTPTAGFGNMDHVKSNDDIVNAILPWQGGFIAPTDNPRLASNFGISLVQLTAWRGRPTSLEDLKDLSLSEAKAYYLQRLVLAGYDQVKDTPVRAALLFIAVHAGDGRANRLAQKALENKFNYSQPVDSQFGPSVIKAINAVSDASALRAAIACEYYLVLRSHPSFERYKENFMGRVKAIFPANRTFDC